ncbi:MAG: AI-2E family transporter [Anaerolineae bacterium]
MEPVSQNNVAISTRQIALWTATAILVAAFMFLLFWLRDLVLLFLVGIVMAAAFRPLILRVQRRRFPKAASVVIVYLVFISLILASFAVMMPTMSSEVVTLAEESPARYAEMQSALQNSNSGLLRALGASIPSGDQLVASLGGMMGGSILLDMANSLSSLLEAFATIILVAFYWNLDQPRLERWAFSLVPAVYRSRSLTAWREMEDRMGAYVRGTIFVAVLIGVLTGAGYAVIGLPFALFLAVLAGLGEFIPVVGFIIGLVPAVLVAMTVSPQLVLMVVLINVALRVVQHFFIWPMVMSNSVGLSPLILLLALFVFGALFGAIGAFMAIPLAAIIQVALDYALLKDEPSVMDEVAAETRPLEAARMQLKALQETLRERMRQRDEYLDVDTGLDAVDHRIDRIVESVESAIGKATQDPERVETSVVKEIEEALAEVDALKAEVRDKSSAVGVSPEEARRDPTLLEDVNKVIREAREVLMTAATEIQGIAHGQGDAEAKQAADLLEARRLDRPARDRAA